MKRFVLIRHGQSEDNAGISSTGLGLTPLTARGQEQAEIVAQHLTEQPDKIVVSPFIRTHQTAAPTMRRYPDAQVVEWPIEEFRQLGKARYNGMSIKERSTYYYKHWEKNDPDYIEGDGAESLNQMLDRLLGMKQRLIENEADLTYVFCHGFFLRAFAFLHFLNDGRAVAKNMGAFHQMMRSIHMHNCAFIPGFVQNGEIYLGQLTIDHIPAEKRT